jgi:hypothetical protein
MPSKLECPLSVYQFGRSSLRTLMMTLLPLIVRLLTFPFSSLLKVTVEVMSANGEAGAFNLYERADELINLGRFFSYDSIRLGLSRRHYFLGHARSADS